MTGWRHQLVLAGRSLRIEGNSEAAREAVAPALAHLQRDLDARHAESGLQWIVEDATDDDRRTDAQGVYRLPGGGLTMVQQDPFSIVTFAPDRGIRLAASPAGFASGDLRAHPGSIALGAWFSGPAAQVLHVGAVAFGSCGVLLVGASGAGKSTSVLACALAGADFLGDDLCLVTVGDDPNAPPNVHSLFATAKLNPDSARRLGADAWPTLGTTPKDKVVTHPPPPIRIIPSAPLVAVVVLARSGGGPGAPTPLRPAEAFGALAATGASPCSGALSPSLWFSAMSRLVRRVPAYRLPITWDLERVAGDIRRIADDAARRSNA